MIPIFVLSKPRCGTDESETDFFHVSDNDGDAPSCPQCGRYIGMIEWLPPYSGELELWGSQFADVVKVPGGLVVSERFKNAFKEHNLSGLNGFHPVHIVRAVCRRKKIPGDIPPYFYTTVVQSVAPVDDKASEIVRSRPKTCDWCFSGDPQRASRIVLNLDAYQGEDIFIARGLPGRHIVSEQFRDVCEQHQIRNTQFIPCEQYHFEYGNLKKSN